MRIYDFGADGTPQPGVRNPHSLPAGRQAKSGISVAISEVGFVIAEHNCGTYLSCFCGRNKKKFLKTLNPRYTRNPSAEK